VSLLQELDREASFEVIFHELKSMCMKIFVLGLLHAKNLMVNNAVIRKEIKEIFMLSTEGNKTLT
jgi:hypothetical protein